MKPFIRVRTLPVVAAGAALILSLAACGSDSTAPGSVDAAAALQSLAIGLNGSVGAGSSLAGGADASYGGVAPLLDRVNIIIDGKSHTMFALGLRETFPAGTCAEAIFIDPAFPPLPGECTSPDLGMALLFWESHAANAPPDRMIFIIGDVGNNDFDFLNAFPPTAGTFQAPAIYLQGQNDVSESVSGTLTSQVVTTGQSCSLPLPPFAKSATCNMVVFDPAGSISFETFSNIGAITGHVNITIPKQSVHGIWQAITETKPVTLPL